MSELKELSIMLCPEFILYRRCMQPKRLQKYIILHERHIANPAPAFSSPAVETDERRHGAHAARAVVAHGKRRDDGFVETHELSLRPGDAGDAVGDLLPPGPGGPFAVGSEAGLGDVDDSHAWASSGEGVRCVSQLRESAGPVAVYDYICRCEQVVELLPAGRCLEVDVEGVFPGVAVDLEVRDVGEARGGYFYDLCAVFGECAADGGTGYYTAELNDADAVEYLGG